MSNALAIASVTAILKDLLNDGLINRNLDSLFSFQVTAQPPDRISANGDGDINRLNLYLYRVTPNTGWINQRLPSRSASGQIVDNPYLALDLHYVLSAFATEDLNAEVLLGYAMQVLHETPVLDRDAIRTALGAGSPLTPGILPAGFQQLSPAEIADQFEQLRVTPYYVDLEEISKIWTAFNTPLRMSVLYQVTTVLIESRRSSRSTLPVRSRGVFVRQLQHPAIYRVLSQGPADPEPLLGRQVVHGDSLVLEGAGLRGEITVVAVGDLEVPPAEATGERVTVPVPASLHPGATGVQVVHRIAKLPPSVETMPGESSNLAVFVLHPTIAAGGITLLDAALETAAPPGGPVRGTVRVQFAHNAGSRQRTELLLNEVNPPNTRPAFAYTFRADSLPDPPPAEVSQRDFTIRQVEQAAYMVRVRIDGAESLLEMTGGVFSGPQLVVAA